MNKAEMIAEVYIWVLSGVLGFLLTVFIIAGRIISKNIGNKINDLVLSIQKLTKLTVQQTEQIKTLYNNKEETRHILNLHEGRIRDLEFTQIAKGCRRYENIKKD